MGHARGQLADGGELGGVGEHLLELLPFFRHAAGVGHHLADGEEDDQRHQQADRGQADGEHQPGPVHAALRHRGRLHHQERPGGLLEPGVGDQGGPLVEFDLLHPGGGAAGRHVAAARREGAAGRVHHLVLAAGVDQGGLHLLAVADGAEKHVQLVRIQGGAHAVGRAVEHLAHGDGEVGDVAQAGVDVADQVVAAALAQVPEPGLLAVVPTAQLGVGAGVADLDAPGVEETDIDEAVMKPFQALQIVVHGLLRGLQAELAAVEQVEQVDHPFLQVQVDGVFLVFRHRLQVEQGAVLQGVGELEMEIGRQQGVGQQEPEQQAQHQPGLQLPEVVADALPVGLAVGVVVDVLGGLFARRHGVEQMARVPDSHRIPPAPRARTRFVLLCPETAAGRGSAAPAMRFSAGPASCSRPG